MREFNRPKNKNAIVVSFLTRGAGVLFLLILAIVSVKGTWEMYNKFSEAIDGEGAAKSDLASLQAQQAQVGAAVVSLSTDRGVEAQMRERYGVAKPGEGEIDIVQSATSTDVVTPAPQENLFMRIVKGLFVW
jgi:cell division protein FtsB